MVEVEENAMNAPLSRVRVLRHLHAFSSNALQKASTAIDTT